MKKINYLWIAVCVLLTAATRDGRLTVVNAAGFAPLVASDSICAAFGARLTSNTAEAVTNPLPVNLRGVRVWVGAEPAGIFYISPQQVNFHLPAVQPGSYRITLRNENNETFIDDVAVGKCAPGVFTRSRNGLGLADSFYVSDATFDYLILFGTGVKWASGLKLQIPGVGEFAPAFAGQAPGYTGEDQINIPLPRGTFNGFRHAFLAGEGCASQSFVIQSP